MQPYVEEHLNSIIEERNGRSNDWVIKQHRQRLTEWLRDQNIQPRESEDSITVSMMAGGGHRDK
jgi:hypothetical protein